MPYAAADNPHYSRTGYENIRNRKLSALRFMFPKGTLVKVKTDSAPWETARVLQVDDSCLIHLFLIHSRVVRVIPHNPVLIRKITAAQESAEYERLFYME